MFYLIALFIVVGLIASLGKVAASVAASVALIVIIAAAKSRHKPDPLQRVRPR